MFGREYSCTSRMRPRKLDSRLHALASRRSEERLRQTPPGALTQLLRQFAGKVRNMRLNHSWTTTLEFALQSPHNIGMIVADVVNTVPREKVEDALSVLGEEFHSLAPHIADIHLQQVEEPHPLPVHALGIALRRMFSPLDLECCSHLAWLRQLGGHRDRCRQARKGIDINGREGPATGIQLVRLNLRT